MIVFVWMYYSILIFFFFFFFSSRRRHTRWNCDWSSDVCSSDLGDRHLELTDKGRALAISVMRKHRIAERLLVDVIGLPWEEVHAEACRWEHVMSDDVERRLMKVLNNPTTSPFGNPIPGLVDLGVGDGFGADDGNLVRLTELPAGPPVAVVVRQLTEHVQGDIDLITR